MWNIGTLKVAKQQLHQTQHRYFDMIIVIYNDFHDHVADFSMIAEYQ